MSKITEGRDEVALSAAGVCSVDDGRLQCNDENLLTALRDAILRQKPRTDWNGQFAAEIMIQIKFLGEMEETDEQLSQTDLQ